MDDIIIFLKVEAIKAEKQKKSGKYSVHLEIEPGNQTALKKSIWPTAGAESVEINIDDRFVRKLHDFETFHKKPASIRNISIAETLEGQLKWENVLGIEIYETFFPGDIGETFGAFLNLLPQRKDTKITLVISSPIAWILDIPFEMMRRETEGLPISLFHERFHLIHSAETSLSTFRDSILEPVAPPLKLLFVSALPVDLSEEERLIELEKEQELLINSLGELISKKQVVVEFLDIATLEEIKSALKEGEHHVVHFCGHGSYNEDDSRKTGVLYLEDEWGNVKDVTGKELAICLKKFPSIRLVVLSACESAHAHESGVTGAMLAEGIPAVLGMRYPVNDNAATQFTSYLYDDICKGKHLDRAMFMARQALYDQDVENIKARQQQKQEALFPSQWMIPFFFMKQNLTKLIDHSKYPTNIHQFFQNQSSLVQGEKYVGRGFIGRHKELLDLYRLFREGQRSVCIYGQGGTGKTTLAVRFAHNFEKGAYRIFRFNDEVTEESILSRMAEEAFEFMGESVKEFVKSPDYKPTAKLNLLIENFLSQQKVIILFDNFEENQVASTEKNEKKIYQRNIHSESLKDFLIHLCKNIKAPSYILFTTRYLFPEPEISSLNLGELRFSDTFKLLNRFPKLVQLNTEEKHHVHNKLGGHPRALELLESCISHKNIGWENVSRKLKEVEKKEIHHDLLLNMLWEQLTENEQLTLRGASIFRRLTEIEGLAAVTGQKLEITKQLVNSLNSRSLLYLESGKFYVCRLNTSFIEYSKMPEEQKLAFHVAAAKYIIKSTKNQVNKYVDNLLEARWHLLKAAEWDLATHITLSIGDHLMKVGYPQLSYQIVNEVLEKNINETSRTSLLILKGMLAQHFCNYEEATDLFQTAMKKTEKFDFEAGTSLSLLHIGWIHHEKGHIDKAIEFYQKSLELSRKTGDMKSIAWSLNHIGWAYHDKGDFLNAEKNLREALKILESSNDFKHLSAVVSNIAMLNHSKGKLEESLIEHQKALLMRKSINDTLGISISLYNIGTILFEKNQYETAKKYFDESLILAEKIGDTKGIADCLSGIGTLHKEKKENQQALSAYKKALSLKKKIGDQRGVTGILNNMATICFENGEYENAIVYYQKMAAIMKDSGITDGIPDILEKTQLIHAKKLDNKKNKKHLKSINISQETEDSLQLAANDYLRAAAIHQLTGNFDTALDYYKKAVALLEKIQDTKMLINCLPIMASVYQSAGDYENAIMHLNKSLELIKKAKDEKFAPSILHQLGMIYQDKGDYNEALNCYQKAIPMFRKAADTKGIGNTLHQIGMIFQSMALR
jgi:tetratricopeptide (TPR) repeat protein